MICNSRTYLIIKLYPNKGVKTRSQITRQYLIKYKYHKLNSSPSRFHPCIPISKGRWDENVQDLQDLQLVQ